jgi:hypothetical protein
MFKGSNLRGFLLGLLVLAAVGALVWFRIVGHGEREGWRPPLPGAPATAPAARPADCVAPRWAEAARANQVSLHGLQWSPFGKPELGWAIYAPLVSQEIGARCPADSGGFAQSYAVWQVKQKLQPDGVFKADEFDRMRDAMALRRPFVQQTAKGLCPAAPSEAALALARPEESFGGKKIWLRPGALDAYRRMVAAARADGLAQKPPLLQIASAYRGPAEEAARCADGGCDSLSRARCSAHRTGLAVDLYLDPAPGHDPISTDDENRRHMAASAEYRWLVTNAGRFGFLPYAYEPWHWEWTGEAP